MHRNGFTFELCIRIAINIVRAVYREHFSKRCHARHQAAPKLSQTLGVALDGHAPQQLLSNAVGDGLHAFVHSHQPSPCGESVTNTT